MKLSDSYEENVRKMDELLRVDESFDLLKKTLQVGDGWLTFYYIDGFIKDGVMAKMMIFLLGLKTVVPPERQGASPIPAERFIESNMPYVEAEATDSVDTMVQMVLSGATLILGTGFGAYAVVVDARTYPARETGEPEGDKVMRGARDGFVETLIFNTALIRRRIRDPKLTMSYHSVGTASKTDLVLCYVEGRADPKYVEHLKKRLASIDTDSLTLGHESLAESLIKSRWYNPFPKIRYTERPDTAAAQLLEGSVLILCDNSPEAMILPTSIFDFMQETNDFYFPPFTGSYVRVVRHCVFWLTLFLIPTW